MDKPNILFILSDDQGSWSLGSYGNDEVISPNIDNLAKKGIRFDNFFCTSPVCSPARASIVTGRIPSQHGVHDWIAKGNIDDPNGNYRGKDRGIEYLKGMKGYTEFLKEAGYTVGISGKWHLGAQQMTQKGFDYWYVHGFGGGDYYNYPMVENGKLIDKTNYVTDEITDGSIRFLDKHSDEEKPFYLSVHYTAPHSPYNKTNHPKEVWDLYKDCKFESVPKLPVHKWQKKSGLIGDTEEKRIKQLTGYYTAITAMDNGIGKIIETLKEKGCLENTIIIFTADNGMNMGQHGLWGKGNASFPMNMYDTSVKVPFIISYPKKIKDENVETGLYSQYDIMPTLLNLLDIKNPEESKLPGKSFLNIIDDKNQKQHDEIVIFDEYGPVRMIRSKQYKYIHRYPYGPQEFYNLETDPNEENNLFETGFENNKEKIKELRQKLESWFKKYSNPDKDGIGQPITGRGQIDLSDNITGEDSFLQEYEMYWD